jgi:hypothetical protein
MNMRKFIFIAILFSFGFFIQSASAADILYDRGGIYLPASAEAYVVNGPIFLNEKSVIRIDKGVKIDFGPNGDICFFKEDCLKGDWFLKSGLKSCLVLFSSDVFVYVGSGVSSIPFKVSRSGTSLSYEKTKSLPIFVKSLAPERVTAKVVSEAGEYDFDIDFGVITTSDKDRISDEGVVLPEVSKTHPTSSKAVLSISSSASSHSQEIDWSFATAKKGFIFIETEKRGEAWYVNPGDFRRYFLGRPNDAFSIMKRLGLGVRHEVIEKGVFSDRLKGRVLIDVDDKGKAYYIDPRNKKAYYLGRPEDAFKVMVDLGVGINEENIRRIGIGMI